MISCFQIMVTKQLFQVFWGCCPVILLYSDDCEDIMWMVLCFQIKVAELLSEVFGVLAKHQVKMESNFAMIILAIGVLEGLGRSLDPNIDILEKAKPVLLKQAMKL